jgi:hypothetical protein
VQWSNGDVEGANKTLQEARRRAIEGDNSIRNIFTALMASALKP